MKSAFLSTPTPCTGAQNGRLTLRSNTTAACLLLPPPFIAGGGVAVAIRRLVAPGGQDRSNLEVGLVFGGQVTLGCPAYTTAQSPIVRNQFRRS